MIGYSLPEADSAACALIGAAHAGEKRIAIVDRTAEGAERVRGRLTRITGAKQVATYNSLEEFLDCDPKARLPRGG